MPVKKHQFLFSRNFQNDLFYAKRALWPTEVICLKLEHIFSVLVAPDQLPSARRGPGSPILSLSQGLIYGAVGAGKVTATGPTREQIYVTPTQTHSHAASDCELAVRLALLRHLHAGRIRRWRRGEVVVGRPVIALPGPLGHSLR